MKRYIRSSSISGMSVSERVRLAESSNDPEVLAKLADDSEWRVRYELASHTSDPEILAKLADDADYSIRAMVAEHTDDPRMLAKLADDENWNVRWCVASLTTDSKILAKLANDPQWMVRAVVAKQTDDPKILAKLANDEVTKVRKNAEERSEKSADSKEGKNVTSSSWPSSDWWYDLDDESFEDAWQEYLSGPEDEVNKELQIFPEPSVQGNRGSLVVYDESGQDRQGEDENWYIDWQDYLDWQVDAAAASKNAAQYKKKYRKFMKELCGI